MTTPSQSTAGPRAPSPRCSGGQHTSSARPRWNLPAARLLGLAFVLSVSTLGACERVEPSVIGQWSAADPDTEWTVHMREDSTWAMQVGTLEGEGTFTRDPHEDAIVLHTAGNMADVMPRGFRGHLEADTLRLCSAAGCADMVRTDSR